MDGIETQPLYFARKPLMTFKGCEQLGKVMTDAWKEKVTDNETPLLTGEQSVHTVGRWMDKFSSDVKTALEQDVRSLFVKSSTTEKDTDRPSRWGNHLSTMLFEEGDPKKHHLESENDYKTLLTKFNEARSGVLTWACHFVLHNATSATYRVQLNARLQDHMGPANNRGATLRDWQALKQALLDDAGPEPNHHIFRAQACARAIASESVSDPARALCQFMDHAQRRLVSQLGDISLGLLRQLCQKKYNYDQPVGHPEYQVSAGDAEMMEELEPFLGEPNEDVTELRFSALDVHRILQCGLEQFAAHTVLNHHMGMTFGVDARREMQRQGIVLRRSGEVKFGGAIPYNTPPQDVAALSGWVKKKCEETTKAVDSKRSKSERASGKDAAAGDTKVTMLSATRQRSTICFNCDRDSKTKGLVASGHRCGHNTADCPKLVPCSICDRRHTADYAKCTGLARGATASGGAGGDAGGHLNRQRRQQDGGGGGAGSDRADGGGGAKAAARGHDHARGGPNSSAEGKRGKGNGKPGREKPKKKVLSGKEKRKREEKKKEKRKRAKATTSDDSDSDSSQ
jgi:hypothetical protein